MLPLRIYGYTYFSLLTIILFAMNKKSLLHSGIVIAAITLLSLPLTGCNENSPQTVETGFSQTQNSNYHPKENGTVQSTSSQTTENEAGKETGSETGTTQSLTTEQMSKLTPDQQSQLTPPQKGDKIAILDTDLGTIKFKLFPDLAPEMVKNFETLATEGKYNNVPFHRVIEDFMIQTGDFTRKNGLGGYSYKGPGTELPDEITSKLQHLYGTVSMANHGPNTNGSQFFIVTNKNGTPHLDGGYSIFGQVYEGMDVALRIASLQAPGTDAPSQQVLIKSAKVEAYK